MEKLIREDINRINQLMRLTEEDNIGSYIDSTYLKTPDQAGISSDETDVIVFDTIQDAIEHNMKLVMLRPEYVRTAREFIDSKGANVLVGTVIDFPHGDSEHGVKMDEALEAIENGVDELDFVVDYKAFLSGNLDKVMKEVSEGTAIGISKGKTVKWIIESGALGPQAIAELHKIFKSCKNNDQDSIDLFLNSAQFIGLMKNNPSDWLNWGKKSSIDEKKLEILINKRDEARAEGKYEDADKIRNEIENMGVILEDKDGKTSWRLR